MHESRRDFITLGATLAAGVVLNGQARAADASSAPVRQTLTATTDLRLATFALTNDATLHAGVVLSDGRVLDIGAEAKRKSMALAFNAATMLSLIAAGDAALKQVRALAEGAQDRLPKLDEVHLAAPIPVAPRNVYAVG